MSQPVWFFTIVQATTQSSSRTRQSLSLFVQRKAVKRPFDLQYVFATLHGNQDKTNFPVIHTE